MKKNKIFEIYGFIIVFVILCLSIGYSAFGSDLMISKIIAEVRIKSDIRVTDISLSMSDDANGGNSSYEEYDVNKLHANFDLPNENSSVVYKVEVTNFGSADMAILDITGLPENLNYSLSDYKLKQKICDENNVCTLGIKKEFYITIKYAEGMFNSNNTDFKVSLELDFREFYSVSYENILDIDDYPTEVLGGTTLKLDFGQNESDYIDVFVNGVESNKFDIDGGVITVNNISGNIKFVLPLDEVSRVYFVYNDVKYSNVAPKDKGIVSFPEVALSSGVVLRCNNSAVPTYNNNVVGASSVSVNDTVCTVFDSLKSSVETSDTSLNNLLMIDNEIATSSFEVSSNKNISLDLNGKTNTSTISGDTEETSIYITNNGKFTVFDNVGTGLMKTNYYLFNNYGTLTINSGNYQRQNDSSTVGAIVLSFDGNTYINNANLTTDKTYVVFTKGVEAPLIKINNSVIKAGASSGGALTNNGTESIISAMNSTISNGANNAIYTTATKSYTYICGSTIIGAVADIKSTNGKVHYSLNTKFSSGNNTPVVAADNSHFVVKNYLSTCSDEWYYVRDINGSRVKNSNGSFAKVGEELQIESQISSQLVMDFNAGTASEGNNVWTYTPWPVDKVDNLDAQRFTFLASEGVSSNYYNIGLYFYPTFFLHNSGDTITNGNPILVSAASISTAGRFRIKPITSNYYSFVTRFDTCIDVPAASTEIKTNLQNYTCNGTNAQSWKLNLF